MTAAEWSALYRQLIRHEGLRLTVYNDSLGIPSIGVGRNLRDKGISKNEAMDLLRNDVMEVLDVLAAKIQSFYSLSPIRQRVLIDMAVNLGPAGLMKFKKTLSKIATGDYDGAATAMLQSKWAKQVGERAQRLSRMMRDNEEQP